MQDNNQLNRKVEDTLKLLDNIKPIESNPFLFEKIKDRLEAKQYSSAQRPSFMLSTIRVFGLAILLLLNVYIVSSIQTKSNETASISEENLDYIIESYGLNSSQETIYN